jgi:hypothetical protein
VGPSPSALLPRVSLIVVDEEIVVVAFDPLVGRDRYQHPFHARVLDARDEVVAGRIGCAHAAGRIWCDERLSAAGNAQRSSHA